MVGAAAVLFVVFMGVAALTPLYYEDTIDVILYVLIPVVPVSFGMIFVKQPALPEWVLAVLVFGVPTIMGFVLTYNMMGVVSPMYVKNPVLRAVFKVEKDPKDEMRAKVAEQQRIEGEYGARANLYVLPTLGACAA